MTRRGQAFLATAFASLVATAALADAPALTNLYEYERNGVGGIIETRIAQDDEPEIWLNGAQITFDDAIQFSPAINAAGHYAWAVTGYSNSASDIVLDGTQVANLQGLNWGLKLSSDQLLWLNYNYQENAARLCRLPLAPPMETPACRLLPLLPSALWLEGARAWVAGVDPVAEKWRVMAFTDDLGTSVVDQSFLAPILALRDATDGVSMYRIVGGGNLGALFWSYASLHGQQWGEPFAFGNDAMGRLSNNQTYRLLGLGELYRKTGDPDLVSLFQQSAEQVLDRAADDDLFYSLKYSLDRATPIAFAVDVANLYRALLRNSGLLSGAQRDRLLGMAESAYARYETDWIGGQYYFPSCINFAWDGIPMPFNMQNALGLLALELHRHTGMAPYLARFKALFEHHIAAMEAVDGLALWHYWPADFYAGWSDGDYDNCHDRSRAATSDPYFEDVWHATTNLSFLWWASRRLYRPLPIDLNGLADRLHRGGWTFSRYISGDTSLFSADYRFLPGGLFATTDLVRPFYQVQAVLPYVDFDNQLTFWSHTLALQSTQTVNRDLQVRRAEIDPRGTWHWHTELDVRVVGASDACVDVLSSGQPAVKCSRAVSEWWKAHDAKITSF